MGATRPHTSSASVKHAHKWQICIQRKQRQPNTTARKYSAICTQVSDCDRVICLRSVTIAFEARVFRGTPHIYNYNARQRPSTPGIPWQM